jgi:hypothetical protein
MAAGETRVNAAPPIELRDRLADKYVGRLGIHGIGIGLRHSEYVIFIYAEHVGPEQKRLLGDIQDEATPYRAELREEAVPVLK